MRMLDLFSLILSLEWIAENPTIQQVRKNYDSDVKIYNEPSVKKDECEKVLAKTEPTYQEINTPNDANGGGDHQQDEGR